MKYLSAIGLAAITSLSAVTGVYAQGASDPGFSSVGAMRSHSTAMVTDDVYEFDNSSVSLSNGFAQAEEDVMIVTPQLETRMHLRDMGYFDIKIPIVSTNGELGKITNLGNVLATYTHVFYPNNSYYGSSNWLFQATGGFSIGMGTGNERDGRSRPLPMVYQPSLGTTDLIVGGSVTFKKYVTFAAAYQLPVYQYNMNAYTGFHPVNDNIYSSNYQPTKNFYRKSDVMVRLEGHYSGQRAGIAAGPLVTYHLANDLYMNLDGRYKEIDGSTGLTLNIAGNVFVRFGRYAQWKLDVGGAGSVVNRDVIPDGLSRTWVVIPRLSYTFGLRELVW